VALILAFNLTVALDHHQQRAPGERAYHADMAGGRAWHADVGAEKGVVIAKN